MDARRLFAAVALSLTLGLTACSGGNDPSGEPPTTSPPEPADSRPVDPQAADFPQGFVKKVEPICVQTKRTIDDLAPIEDEQRLLKAITAYEVAARKFRELNPPQENAEAYDRFVEVYRDAARTLRDLLAEIRRGDSSAFQRVPPILDDVATEGGSAAEDYGFSRCISD